MKPQEYHNRVAQVMLSRMTVQGFYRNTKNFRIYCVTGWATNCTNGAEEGELWVKYMSSEGKEYTRKAEEFYGKREDGSWRFEPVEM